MKVSSTILKLNTLFACPKTSSRRLATGGPQFPEPASQPQMAHVPAVPWSGQFFPQDNEPAYTH